MIIIESHSILNDIGDSGADMLAGVMETNITITSIEFWWKNSTVSSFTEVIWTNEKSFPVFISFLSFWGLFLFPLKKSLILRNTWTPSIQFNYVHSFHLNTLSSWKNHFELTGIWLMELLFRITHEITTCIESYSFRDCKSLESVSVQKNITRFQTWTICGCVLWHQ